MHAQPIIQDLLDIDCPSVHARYHACLVLMTGAASEAGLRLTGISRASHDSVAVGSWQQQDCP